MKISIVSAVKFAIAALCFWHPIPITAAPPEAKHWGYTDSPTTLGPESWGKIPGDQLCGIGTQQTPIDLPLSGPAIVSLKEDKAPSLNFNYKAGAGSVLNNGHSIRVDPVPGASTLTIQGETLRLDQFHFHAPSEHSVGGKFYPMEAHFVHSSDQGKAPVAVGVFIEKGEHNKALDSLFSNLPGKSGEKIKLKEGELDPSALLPTDQSYFHYMGSLTTPPCGEGLQWYVLRNPIQMDAEQIRAFTSIPGFDHTRRPLQPLGKRKIEKSGP
jgi:carbonic anhydrase